MDFDHPAASTPQVYTSLKMSVHNSNSENHSPVRLIKRKWEWEEKHTRVRVILRLASPALIPCCDQPKRHSVSSPITLATSPFQGSKWQFFTGSTQWGWDNQFPDTPIKEKERRKDKNTRPQQTWVGKSEYSSPIITQLLTKKEEEEIAKHCVV